MTNAVSTTFLFERLRCLDRLDRYVHVTTPEVYGGTEGWVHEDAPFKPTAPYAVSRAAGDVQLRIVVAVRLALSGLRPVAFGLKPGRRTATSARR